MRSFKAIDLWSKSAREDQKRWIQKEQSHPQEYTENPSHPIKNQTKNHNQTNHALTSKECNQMGVSDNGNGKER